MITQTHTAPTPAAKPEEPDVIVTIPVPIHLATDAAVNTHYPLGCAQLTKCRNGLAYIVGTESRMACAVEVDCEAPIGSYLIPRDVLPQEKEHFFRKIWRKKGTWFTGWGRYDEVSGEGKFPRVQDVLPHVQEGSQMLSLNPKLLSRIAKVLGANELVTLILPPPAAGRIDGCLGVVGDNYEQDGIAALMTATGDGLDPMVRYEKLRDSFVQSMPAPPPKPVPFDRALLGC